MPNDTGELLDEAMEAGAHEDILLQGVPSHLLELKSSADHRKPRYIHSRGMVVPPHEELDTRTLFSASIHTENVEIHMGQALNPLC